MRFEIEPKIGLGNFILGMNINQVLSLIKRNGYYYKHCKIISNKDKNTPIFLHLPSELITLRFNYYTQNLELIEKKILVENNIEKNTEINDDTEYYYKNKLFFVQNKNKEFHIIKYQNIAQLFGLSKVPKKLNKNKNIFLEYSGIGFYFTNIVIDPEKNEDLDISADPSSVDTNSVLTKFFIFREDSLYESLNKKNIFNENNVEIKYDSKKGKSISIKNLENNNKSVIKIGDNIDDVLRELKNPNYIYYSNDKNDNYNQVQDNGDTLYNQTTNKIFYLNYFNYGLDIMICNNKVNRIILHTNQIGDSKFGIYERCNFKLKLRKEYLNSLIDIENKINDKKEDKNINNENIKDRKNETNLRKNYSKEEKKEINDNKNEEKKGKIEIKKEEINKFTKNNENNIKKEKIKNENSNNKEKSIECDDSKEKNDKDININNKNNNIKEIHQIKNINEDINNDVKKEIKKEEKEDEKEKLINLSDNKKDSKNMDNMKKETDLKNEKDEKNKEEELSNENILSKKDDLNIENIQKDNNAITEKSNKESENKNNKEEKNDEQNKKEEEKEDEKNEVKENEEVEEEKKEVKENDEEKKEEEKKEEEKKEEEIKNNENKISQKNNNYSNKNNRKRRKKHGNPPKKNQKINSEEEDESADDDEKEKINEKIKKAKDEYMIIFPWTDFKEEFLSKIQYQKL